MTIETATYINDLQPVNPPSTDPVSQGDDHLRLIKQVLQNTFANASRQFQIPTARTVSTTTTLLKSDGAGKVYVSTAGGAVVLTMPTLVALDAGWSTEIIKTTGDVNPMFITPPSGNISSAGYSVARARRCIPHRRFSVVWDGANWYCERINSLPMGSLIDLAISTALPAGYEWPNGQTLASAATNYPEYNAYAGSGVTPDTRGCALVALDNLGGAARGLLGNVIAGTTFGAFGGTEVVTLSSSQVPSLSVSVSGSCNASGTFYIGGNSSNLIPYTTITPSNQYGGVPGGTSFYSPSIYIPSGGVWNAFAGVSGSVSGSCSASGTASGGGGNHSNLQPSIIISRVMVVE